MTTTRIPEVLVIKPDMTFVNLKAGGELKVLEVGAGVAHVRVAKAERVNYLSVRVRDLSILKRKGYRLVSAAVAA